MIAPGNLGFPIVRLADEAVGESRERVRAAQRIAVNLSPADLAKEGDHYDLPIVLVLLAGMGVIAGIPVLRADGPAHGRPSINCPISSPRP